MSGRTRYAFARMSLAVVVSVFGILPTDADAFDVQYDYYVFATRSDGIPIADDAILTGQASVSGSFTKNGDPLVGNYGTASFQADLATGSIGSFSQTYGARIANTGYTGTGRVESIAFRDVLRCTVPAGTYAEGLSLSLSGQVFGSLSASLNAGARAQYFINFGADGLSSPVLEIGTSESATISVNDPFTLIEQLVAPGGVLPSEQTFPVTVFAGFNGNRASTTSAVPGEYTAQATVDFNPGLRIFSLEVPTNVDCTSDSGVFLSDPSSAVSALSEWGMVVLVMALLGCVAWLLGRRRGPELA